MINPHTLQRLFPNTDDGLILSYLQGYMGYALVDNEDNPTSAQIVVGDFAFFGGIPNAALIKNAQAPILTPLTKEWEIAIENTLGDKITKSYRYKIKKQREGFDTNKLSNYIHSLDKKYDLKKIDESLYKKILQEDWSKDLCSQFNNFDDFNKRGLGFVILYKDSLVSGASSYVVFDNSLEIEIDTKRDMRGQNLATICGSQLILACIHNHIYPSWDAIDLRSVALAEKLGYQLDHPYVVYY